MSSNPLSANSMKHITAPFSAEVVHRLNQRQVGVDDIAAMFHPFTCPNRGDGAHGDEGGDLGVLVATREGWICPHCEYTQDWTHASMAQEGAPFPAGSLGLTEDEARTRKIERVDARLSAYKALRLSHFTSKRIFTRMDEAVKTMIASLNLNRLALHGIEVDLQTQTVIPDTQVWIPLQDKEPPAPGYYEVLYVDAHVGNPGHPGYGAGGWIECDNWKAWTGSNCFAGTVMHGGGAAYWREMAVKERERLNGNARAEAMPTVHLHAQSYWHDAAYINGNRAGLLALRQAIDDALQEPREAAAGRAETRTNDGEGYDLIVRCVHGQHIYKLALPYTDEVAKERDAEAIWPWNDQDRTSSSPLPGQEPKAHQPPNLPPA